jgi:hypothetical protein
MGGSFVISKLSLMGDRMICTFGLYPLGSRKSYPNVRPAKWRSRRVIRADDSVPRTSKPTCSKCSSLLLNHYSNSLSSNSAMNASIIRSAADTVNAACGNSFVSFNTAAANSAPCPIPLVYDRTTSLFLLGIITALPFMSLLLV